MKVYFETAAGGEEDAAAGVVMADVGDPGDFDGRGGADEL